jgi:hypothetical protein
MPRLRAAVAALKAVAEADADAQMTIHAALRELMASLQGRPCYKADACGQDRKCVEARIRGFDHRRCAAYREFRGRGWDAMTMRELVSIGFVLSEQSGIPMDREATRRRAVLFKWFDEHWDRFRPELDNLRLQFSQ